MPTPARYTLLPRLDTPLPSQSPSVSAPARRRRRFNCARPRILLIPILTSVVFLALLAVYMPTQGLRLCIPGTRLACNYAPPLQHTPIAALARPSTTASSTITSAGRTNSKAIVFGTTSLSRHVSTAAPTTSTPKSTPIAMADTLPGNLALFLQSQKDQLLADLKRGSGNGWTVVTGNEAGDLDSLASAISYAFLSSALKSNRTAALFLTPRKLMTLRPENLLALQRAHIPLAALLHPEDLPGGTEALADEKVSLALVDHNSALPAFGTAKVVAIIDHHEDDGAHLTANPRIIRTPVGSTSSLLTKHFMPEWKASVSGPAGAAGSPVPPELATLLLSAILIDTQGLKKGGKAVDVDYEAAAFLYPLSTLNDASLSAASAASSGDAEDANITAMQGFSDELITTKYNVTGVPTADLLRRDYKQYAWPTSTHTLQVGLSTVPMSLKHQLTADGGWAEYLSTVDEFMLEHDLDITGVLTTFKSETKKKSRRELLLIVRTGGRLTTTAGAKALLASLSAGLEADEVLQLAPWARGKGGAKAEFAAQSKDFLDTASRLGVVWDQTNHHATRKQVAPALAALVSKL